MPLKTSIYPHLESPLLHVFEGRGVCVSCFWQHSHLTICLYACCICWYIPFLCNFCLKIRNSSILAPFFLMWEMVMFCPVIQLRICIQELSLSNDRLLHFYGVPILQYCVSADSNGQQIHVKSIFFLLSEDPFYNFLSYFLFQEFWILMVYFYFPSSFQILTCCTFFFCQSQHWNLSFITSLYIPMLLFLVCR